MKTKLFLFFAMCLMSFGISAQVTSVALVGDAVGGWPGSTGNPGPIDINQLTQVDAENWIIENITIAVGPCKLRANNAWSGTGFEWAGAFPTAVGTSQGDIIVPIAGVYTVTLNTTTGVYNFDSGAPLPVVKLVGACTGTVDGLLMAPSAADTFTATNVTLLDGVGQFSIDGNLFGELGFPSGTILGNTDNIPVVAGVYSSVSLNIASGDYSFELAPVYPSIAIVGAGAGGWPTGAPGEIDANVLATEDGETYKGVVALTADAPNNEIKFRSNNNWSDPNWGGVTFPTGPDPLNLGGNIIVTTAGTYDVVFTRSTGAYAFSIPTIAIVGSATPTGWPTGTPGEIDGSVMSSANGLDYTIAGIALIVGEAKFRANNDWGVNWGAADFPSGVGTQGGANIVIATAGTYNITLNRVTGAYAFTDGLSTSGFNTNAFKVYPNPSSSTWNFVSTADKNITSIQIVDMLGKSVMTINPAANTASVDVTSITNGLYFAKVTTDAGTETVKLMKN
jgi:hypothetical protein